MRNLLALFFIFCSFELIAQYTYYAEASFEYTSGQVKLSIPGSSPLWQVGQAHKIIFNSAYSLPNAIITDTILPYPTQSQSSFILTIKDQNWIMGSPSVMSFWHQYDTDSAADGGYIDISYDGGLNWTNVIYDTADPCGMGSWIIGGHQGWNFYDSTNTLFNEEPGFTGTSQGWQSSSFTWLYCIGVKGGFPDSVMIRFNFISDSINTNKEGWMIDNILLYSNACGGLMPAVGQLEASVYPNPVRPDSRLEFSMEGCAAAQLKVFDSKGKCVFSEQILDSDFPIGKLELPSGLYIYQIKSRDRLLTSGKFIHP